MDVVAYPVRGKQKSRDILAAFVQGAGGELSIHGVYQPGRPAAFWGVDSSNEKAWTEARDSSPGVPYFYGDNSYFDASRGSYFRFTRNAIQHSGVGTSDGGRLASLGVRLSDAWLQSGKHIVVCEQSPYFMRVVAQSDGWYARTITALQTKTMRQVRVRFWNPDKAALGKTLPQDLSYAHALVTWSSAAAVEAVLAGIPVFTDQRSATGTVGYWTLDNIEEPYRPTRDAVKKWAEVLADNQWTVEEMRAGMHCSRMERKSGAQTVAA